MNDKRNTFLAMLIVSMFMLGMFVTEQSVNAMPTSTNGFSSVPATNGTTGTLYTYTPIPSANLTTGGSIIIQSAPSWLSYNGIVISGLPIVAGVSDVRITYALSIYTGGYPSPYTIITLAWQNWTIVVNNPVTPNTNYGFISIPPLNGSVGFSYTYTPSTGHPLQANQTLTTTMMPSWANFNGNSLVGIPTSAGLWGFRIELSNLIYVNSFPNPYSIQQVYAWQNWTVNVTNVPEFLSSPSLIGTVGVNYTYTPILDPSAPPGIVITVVTLPNWASYDGTEIYGTPNQGGAYQFSLRANLIVYTGGFPPYAIGSGFQYQNWTVIVGGSPVPLFNNLPYSPFTMYLGQGVLSFHFNTTIPSDIKILGAPSWLTFSNGYLNGTPLNIGRYRVILSAVSIQYNTSNVQSFDIYVTPANVPNVVVGSMWDTLIPVFFLIIVMLVSAISPMGLSRSVFLSAGTIGTGLMVWAGSFPAWVLIVPAFLIVFMVYQARQMMVNQ